MSDGGARQGRRREAAGSPSGARSEPSAPSDGGARQGRRREAAGSPSGARSEPSAPSDGGASKAREHRRLAALVVAALAGAGCCSGSAAVAWWTRDYHDPLTGALHIAEHGSQLMGELVPVALVALAGLGATFATRGLVRRAVGVLVALGGLLVAVRAALSMGTAPVQQLAGQLTRPATAVGPAELNAAGPVLALIGGVLIVLAGVLVAAAADRAARRMGSAYDAPARRREQALRQVRSGAGDAVDPSVLWRAMDAGADPTDEAPPDAGGTAPDGDDDVPGHSDPSGPDTMSTPDKPADAALDDPDRSGRGDRPDRSGTSGRTRDEESTG